MTTIQKKLFELQDKEYAMFQAKLTPTVDPALFIGVRVPACRALAKNLYKNDAEEVEGFLSELPHKYYDENMLHGLLISEIKDFDLCISELEAFLPHVDNWAVCDIMSPVFFFYSASDDGQRRKMCVFGGDPDGRGTGGPGYCIKVLSVFMMVHMKPSVLILGGMRNLLLKV